MRAAIALVLAAFSLPAHGGPAERERAIALALARRDADEAFRRGDHAGCAAAYLRAFDIDSRQAGDELLYNAGVCLERDADVGRAVEAWGRLARLYPRSPLRPRALARAGIILAQVARFDESAAALEEYGTRYGGEKDAREALVQAAHFRLALGQNARAVRALEHARRLVRPDRPRDAAEMHILLSMAREESGDKEGALRSLATAARLIARRDQDLLAAVNARIAHLRAPRPPRRAESLPERYRRGGHAGDMVVGAPLAAPP